MIPQHYLRTQPANTVPSPTHYGQPTRLQTGHGRTTRSHDTSSKHILSPKPERQINNIDIGIEMKLVARCRRHWDNKCFIYEWAEEKGRQFSAKSVRSGRVSAPGPRCRFSPSKGHGFVGLTWRHYLSLRFTGGHKPVEVEQHHQVPFD